MARLRGKTVFLGDVAQNRDNNLNLLRFLAAAAVALSHSFLLVTGDPESRPLMKATGFSIGYHAVDIFFVISGFLVTQSWMRRNSLLDFTVARALRIYPALAVCVVLTALVLLPPLSKMSAADYFSSFETFSYVIMTASLTSPDGTLPGIFLTTPVANEVNGSLWTLRYEVLCYAALALLGMSGILARRKWLIRTAFVIGLPLAALSLFPIAYADDTILVHFVRFGLCFGLGVLAHEYRAQIPLHWAGVVFLFLLTVAMRPYAVFPLSFYLLTAYSAFWLAYIPGGRIRRFNNAGDYSYGLYIYAYPLQQVLVLTIPGLMPLQLFAVTVATTLPAAILSWYFIEKPALAKKENVSAWLKRFGGQLVPGNRTHL